MILLLLILSACAPILNASQPYYFVTAESAPTLTPFQPGQATPAPTWPIPPSATPSPTAAPTLTATHAPPTSTALQSGFESTPDLPDTPASNSDELPTYNINALWNYTGRSLTVAQEIIYPNRSTDTLSAILLAVNPNLWQRDLRAQLADGQRSGHQQLHAFRPDPDPAAAGPARPRRQPAHRARTTA